MGIKRGCDHTPIACKWVLHVQCVCVCVCVCVFVLCMAKGGARERARERKTRRVSGTGWRPYVMWHLPATARLPLSLQVGLVGLVGMSHSLVHTDMDVDLLCISVRCVHN